MAEGKKSFLIYCDTIHLIDHLTNEEKGILFQHLLEYVNDMNPILQDRVLLSVWKPIERQLKRDLQNYRNTCERNRENALKRWETKNATAYDRIQTHAKHADNDNDIDNDIILLDSDLKRYDDYIQKLSIQKQALESIYETYKLKKGSLSELTRLFIAHLKIYPKRHITQQAFKQHFFQWLSSQEKLNKLNNFKQNVKGQL